MSCSGATSCGMVDRKDFDAIGGTPVRYGSPGDYVRRTISCERSFYGDLVDWLKSLKYFSDAFGGTQMNGVDFIGHAGAFVCKPGCHGRGLALDINRVQWAGVACNMFGGDHASGTRRVRRRYLAVDASCRKFFKYTLDGWYNAQHTNHIHVDGHTRPVFDKQSVSDVGFIQAVCNNFDGAGVTVDGSWGPRTQRAWDATNDAWGFNGCNPFASEVAAAEWCNFVMAHGFADEGASASVYRSLLC
ncbi:MAG TPA: extensin family protein [Actinomycetota bacterium]|nr:extensin family protein [Actinomycetota bacterium]